MMRLTCPNCAAQYEVEDDVIPSGGRDVQCSNCGHTWYQRPNSRPISRPVTELVAPEFPEDGDTAPDQASLPDAPARRTMSEDVSSILRQEAEREIGERETERDSGGLEIQPDLGPMDSDREVRPASYVENEATLEDPDPVATEAAAAAIAARGARRKDLLPDIEEINSTLSPEEQEIAEYEAEEAVEVAKRSGFRRGFIFIVAIFIVMVAVYILAPTIVELNPQTATVMSIYVDWVNGVRSGLDSAMSNIAGRIGALVDGIGSDN